MKAILVIIFLSLFGCGEIHSIENYNLKLSNKKDKCKKFINIKKEFFQKRNSNNLSDDEVYIFDSNGNIKTVEVYDFSLGQDFNDYLINKYVYKWNLNSLLVYHYDYIDGDLMLDYLVSKTMCKR